MATDSTHLLPGDTSVETDTDMASGPDFSSVQLAAASPEAPIPVELPKGNQIVVIRVKPGQTIELPTDSPDGLLAKLGVDGNLAIVVDGRTIVLQGYLQANEEAPIKIVTNDGDVVNITEVIAGTLPDLDIQTAAGPAAAGAQGGTAGADAAGSGIFVPFAAGPLLGGINAEGVLGATQLAYKNIDDERELFPIEEEKEEPAPTPEISIGAESGLDTICVPEDSQGEAVAVHASTDATSHLTTIVISGFPIGGGGFSFSFLGLDLSNTDIIDTILVDGKVTIVFNDAVTTDFSGSFIVTPAADSDIDLGTLTAEVLAVNNVDPTVKASSSDDAFVRVDAIADGDDVGDDGDADKLGVSIVLADGGDLNTSFQVGEAGFVHISASFDDFKDGSETHQLTITAPAGFTFGAPGALPAGVSLVSNDGTTIVLSVDSKDGDGQNGVGSFFLDVPVTYNGGQADGATGNFVATVSAAETPTDEECDTTNNSDTATHATAGVIAETPTPEVQIGAEAGVDHVCVFEDTTSNPIPVTASTNATSHLTTLVISGFPISGPYTVDLTGLMQAGVVSVVNTIGINGSVTITFDGTATNYSGTFTVTPSPDSDVDIGVLTATVEAANNVDPSVKDDAIDQANVVVDAVADGDDVGDDGDGNVLNVTIAVEDGIDPNTSFQLNEVGTVIVTASFDDFHDGSEAHTLLIVAPPGFNFIVPLVGLPLGVTPIVQAPNVIELSIDTTDAVPPAGVSNFALPIPVQFVGGVPDGETLPFTAQVTTTEFPTDLECTVLNNTDTKAVTETTTVATVPTTDISLNTEGREDVVCVPEDSDGVQIPLTATTTPGSHLTTIVISGFPTDAVSDGWVFDFTGLDNADTSVDFSKISVDGTVTITFDNASTTNFNGSFIVTPPVDSDVDLGILTATVEAANDVDPSVTDTDADAAFVRVDAVADGDNAGDDGDGDVLAVTISVTDGGDANATFQDGEVGNVHVTASFDDFKDGSETHSLTVEAPAGFTFDTNNVGTLPTGVTLDGSSTSTKLVFIVDSKDGDGNPGVSDLTLDIPATYGGGEEDGESGDFKATVTTTETPTDQECDFNNNTDSASTTDDVTIAPAPTTDIRIGAEGNTEAICVPEDSAGVAIPVVASTTAGSHLTTIVISGFPTDAVSDGWVFNFTGLDNADTTVDFSQLSINGTVTITFINATTTNFNGSFTVSPPDDSDVDLGTLTATVEAASNVDPTVKDTDADDAFVRVDAVADGDNVGDDGDADVFNVTISVTDGADGNASFQDGEVGTVKVTASYDDFTDGSETHTLTVDAPDGFTFNLANLGTIPGGVVLNIGLSNATHLVFDVDSEGGDGVADFELNIPVTYGGGEEDGESGNFTATVTTTEDPTDLECTTGNNTDSATATDDVVIAVTPTTNVSLNTEGNTDFVCVPEDSAGVAVPVTASTTVGSHLTSIVITGFPIGATGFTFNFAGLDTDGGGAGVTVDTSQLAALGQVTVNFTGVQTAYAGSFTVIPAADSDVDLGTLTATVTAANNIDPSVTDSDADQTYVRVDAIADGDDGDGEKLGVTITSIADGGDANSVFQTGETGTVNVHATFDDYKDGSETHTLTVEAPDNFTFDTNNVGTLPPGVTLDASSTSDKLVFNVDSSNPGGVGSLDLHIPVTYNGGQVGGASGDFAATVTAQENPTDLECNPDNNFASASDTEVAGINDGPKIDLDPNDPNTDDETAVVSDEGLAGGLKDGAGVPSDDSDSKTIVGNFTVTDPDGDVLTVKMLDTGTFPNWTFGGTNDVVDWTLSGDGLTLTGEANGSDALTVVIDPVAHTYTVTLHQSLNHPDKTVEDELSFPITIQVSDGSLTDTAILSVEVEDDSPDAKVVNPTVSAIVLDESPVPPNGDGVVSKTIDLSGAFGAVLAFGGDGAGTDSYKLELSSQGLGSGLYELDSTQPDGKGDEILLTSNGDGSIVTGSVNGTTFFTITVDGDGKVTFAQENNIWHDNTSDHDDAETLTTSVAGNLKLTQTLTDADGDKDSASIDLGSGVFVIQDDGPSAGEVVDTDVLDDEGLAGGVKGGSGDVAGELVTTGGTLSFDFGTDGAGSVGFANLDGKTTTLGSETINLSWSGNTLTGSSAGRGTTVFQVVVNPTTGAYTFTLMDNVLHSFVVGENDASLTLAYQVKDADGDTALGSVTFTIDDDTPGYISPDSLHLENKGVAGTGDQVIANLNFVAGADGISTAVFNVAGVPVGVTSGATVIATDGAGNQLKVGGQLLYLYYGGVDGNDTTILVAKTLAGTVGFTIDIDPTTNTYIYNQEAAISNGTEVTATNLTGLGAGNVPFKLLINVGGTTQDVAMTTKNGESVNSDVDDIGISQGQTFEPGEGIRFDLVNGLQLINGNPDTYSYDGTHNLTTRWKQSIFINAGKEADIIVSAIVADADNIFFGDAAGETAIDLSTANIKIYDDTGTLITDLAGNGITLTDLGTSIKIEGLEDDWSYEIVTDAANKFSAVTVDAAPGSENFSLSFFTYGESSAGTSIDLSYDVVGTDGDGDKTTGEIDVSLYPDASSSSGASFAGTAGNDTFLGNKDANGISGAGGNDLLAGNGGIDTINGGTGNDTVTGGAGADVLDGGDGNDVFVYETLVDGGDKIANFSTAAGGDKLDVKEVLDHDGNTWDDTVSGTVAAAIAGGYITFTDGGGGNVQVNVDIDGAGAAHSAVAVAVLTGVTVASAQGGDLNDNIVVN